MLASRYAYLLLSHSVAGALFDMQGITKSSGIVVSEKPRFLEKGRATKRYESGSQDLISMSEVREDAEWTPLRHQQTVDSDIFWLPRLDLSCDNSVNSRVLSQVIVGQDCEPKYVSLP